MPGAITIVDYGMGNLGSVQNALHFLGAQTVISGSPATVEKADTLLLPGVGSFRAAMQSLESSGLSLALREAVLGKGRKILGICLGMQLLGASSTEDGETRGLEFVAAPVCRFPQQAVSGCKVPHIGFNAVTAGADSTLMHGLQENADFYFVHSYRILADGLDACVSTCSYVSPFVAAFEQNNIFATQFHPEKSQTNGLVLLKNFLAA